MTGSRGNGSFEESNHTGSSNTARIELLSFRRSVGTTRYHRQGTFYCLCLLANARAERGQPWQRYEIATFVCCWDGLCLACHSHLIFPEM